MHAKDYRLQWLKRLLAFFKNKDDTVNHKRCTLLALALLGLTWKLFGAGTTVEMNITDDLGAPVVGRTYLFKHNKLPPFQSFWTPGGVKEVDRILITTDENGKAKGSFNSFLYKSELAWGGGQSVTSNQRYHGAYNQKKNYDYILGTKKVNKLTYIYSLRRQISPHPMLAAIKSLYAPKELIYENKKGLFDMMLWDWLPPYGQGRHADLEFSYEYFDNLGNRLSNSSIPGLSQTKVPSSTTFPAPDEIILRATCRFLGEGNGFVISTNKMGAYNLIYDANAYMNQEAPESGYEPVWTREYFIKKERTDWGEKFNWGYSRDGRFSPRSRENDNILFQFRIRYRPGDASSGHYGFIAKDIFDNWPSDIGFEYAVNEKPGLRNVECSEKFIRLEKPKAKPADSKRSDPRSR